MVETNYLISFARKFVEEHKSVIKIYNNYTNDKGLICFDIDVKVNLPSSHKSNLQTDKGVKNIEKVTLEFPDKFPYKAPRIYLRDDFNRNFPHINPILDKFNPCIFEGSIDELLQQQSWMDGILDQLIDWLETSASNSLINPEQGWEPIRVDDNNGIIIYDREFIIDKHVIKNEFISNVFYTRTGDFLMARVTESEMKINKFENSIILCFHLKKISDEYIPCNIKKFTDLENFAKRNNIDNFKLSINKNFIILKEENINLLFISFFIISPIRSL